MKNLITAVIMLLAPLAAHAAGAGRELQICESDFRVEQAALSTTQATEFSTATASATNLPYRKQVRICNLDSTAANQVWISSFNVTTLVSGVLDTSKAEPLPGGNVADACVVRHWGPNIRFWLFRVIGTAKASVTSCQ
jgi:hypothetical protein